MQTTNDMWGLDQIWIRLAPDMCVCEVCVSVRVCVCLTVWPLVDEPCVTLSRKCVCERMCVCTADFLKILQQPVDLWDLHLSEHREALEGGVTEIQTGSV